MHRLVVAAVVLGLAAGCERQPAGDGPVVAERPETNAAERSAAAPPPPAPLAREPALALMKQRHEDFEAIGKAMKTSARALKSQSPDMAVLARSAATIAELAPQLPGWFPPGTGPDVGKTHARAEIWQQPELFAERARAFEVSARAFDAAARQGDVAAVRTAHADLGKACKACHDRFRHDDH